MGSAKGLSRLLFGNAPKSERKIEAKLTMGWILLSVAVGGWRQSYWLGLLVFAVGAILSAVLDAYDAAQKTERKE